MLAWMAYVTLVGLLLAAAGALLEAVSPWLVGRRRMLWITVIAGCLVLAIAGVLVPYSESGQPRALTSSSPPRMVSKGA